MAADIEKVTINCPLFTNFGDVGLDFADHWLQLTGARYSEVKLLLILVGRPYGGHSIQVAVIRRCPLAQV